MRKFLLLIASVMISSITQLYATTDFKIMANTEITGLSTAGKALLQKTAATNSVNSAQYRVISSDRNINDPGWMIGINNYGYLVDYVYFDNELTYSFEDVPFYLVCLQLWRSDGSYNFPMWLAWPSVYLSDEIIDSYITGENVENIDYEITPIENLINNEGKCHRFSMTNMLFSGYAQDHWDYYSIIPLYYEDYYPRIEDNLLTYKYNNDNPTEGADIIFNGFGLPGGIVSIDTDFHLPFNGMPNDENYVFQEQYIGEASGNMIPSYINPGYDGDYYITGNDVNGECWEWGTETSKFESLGNGIYEWKGDSLGSGFYINKGSEDFLIGTQQGELVWLHEPIHPVWSEDGSDYPAQFIFKYAEKVVDEVVVRMDTRRGFIEINSVGYHPYSYSFADSASDFEPGKNILVNSVGNLCELEKNFDNNGEFLIIADKGIIKYGTTDPNLTITSTGEYRLTPVSSIEKGVVKYNLNGVYRLIFNYDTGVLSVIKDGEEIACDRDFYIIGNDVNGYNWVEGQEDAKFSYIGQGMYTWRGQYLGTSFKINNGSWSGPDNIGGYKGQTIAVGGMMWYYNNVDSQNIGLEGCQGVNNPVVYLNTNDEYIKILGDPVGEIHDWYFMMDEGETQYSYPLVNMGEYYYLECIEFNGLTNFKIANYGLADQYGSFNGKIIDSDNLAAWIWRGSTVPYAQLDLGGLYAVKVYNLGEQESYIEFISLVSPVIPDTIQLMLSNNSGQSLSFPTTAGASLPFTFDFDKYWKLSDVICTINGEKVYIDFTDHSFTTPELYGNTNILTEVTYIGTLEFVDSTTGLVELESSNVTISVENGCIMINGIDRGDSITVYNVSGQIIGNYTAKEEKLEIRLDRGITYIVRVNEAAAKVLL